MEQYIETIIQLINQQQTYDQIHNYLVELQMFIFKIVCVTNCVCVIIDTSSSFQISLSKLGLGFNRC